MGLLDTLGQISGTLRGVNDLFGNINQFQNVINPNPQPMQQPMQKFGINPLTGLPSIISQMPYNVGINSNTQPQFGGMVSVDPDFYRTAGFNPDAQLQQPVGGYGGNPPPVNTPFPTTPFPKQPTIPQPQPNTFANRLKDFGNIYADYIIGRSNAGKASFDPSSGDEAFVNNSGLANAMNQYKNREALKTLQGQQAFDNQIAMRNSISNQEYKDALIKNLTKPEKPKIQSLQGGVFSQVEYPDGKIEIIRNDEVADFIEEQNKIKQQAKTGGQTVFEKEIDKKLAKEFVEDEDALNNDKVNLVKISEIIKEVSDPNFQATGTFVQKLPEFASNLQIFTDKGQKREDVTNRVRNVVQQSLKRILGGAFAMKEADQLIASYFNPKLDESFNLNRLAQLQTQLDAKIKYEEARRNHLIEYGSLSNPKFTLQPPNPEEIRKQALQIYNDAIKTNETEQNLIEKYK